jgi:hypothetical protein
MNRSIRGVLHQKGLGRLRLSGHTTDFGAADWAEASLLKNDSASS